MTQEENTPPTLLGFTVWYGLLTLLACAIVVPVALFFTAPSSWVHHTWRRATAIFPSSASGTIVASGTPGEFVMHITKCRTGERQQFFGVNFFDEDQPRTGGHLVLPSTAIPTFRSTISAVAEAKFITRPAAAYGTQSSTTAGASMPK